MTIITVSFEPALEHSDKRETDIDGNNLFTVTLGKKESCHCADASHSSSVE